MKETPAGRSPVSHSPSATVNEAGVQLRRSAQNRTVPSLAPNLGRSNLLQMCPGPLDVTERDIMPCGCCDEAADSADSCFCGVDDLLRIIRRRYSLAVMNAIHGRGEARYNDVASALPTMSSSTLAETFHALVAAGLASRRQSNDRPQASYALTGPGVKLLRRLHQLLTDLDSA
ncbi:MAG: winged helix-turn-helix transcriptional regulator [Gemmatimonadota bacterium]|nr:winged helix-turn-helix transcriptional regulator [Gemmatimonadota bacterium]